MRSVYKKPNKIRYIKKDFHYYANSQLDPKQHWKNPIIRLFQFLMVAADIWAWTFLCLFHSTSEERKSFKHGLSMKTVNFLQPYPGCRFRKKQSCIFWLFMWKKDCQHPNQRIAMTITAQKQDLYFWHPATQMVSGMNIWTIFSSAVKVFHFKAKLHDERRRNTAAQWDFVRASASL